MFRWKNALRVENDKARVGSHLLGVCFGNSGPVIRVEEEMTDYGPFNYFCPGCRRRVEDLLDIVFQVKGYEVSLKRCQDCIRIAKENIPQN